MDTKSIVSRALHQIYCQNYPADGYDECGADHDGAAAKIANKIESVGMDIQRMTKRDASEYIKLVSALGVVKLTDRQLDAVSELTGMDVGHITDIIERAKMVSGD